METKEQDIISTKEEKTSFDELVQQVYDLVGNPISVWAVAATIESLGVRDVDAQEDYEYASVFDMAEDVYQEIKTHIRAKDEEKKEDDFKLGNVFESFKLFFKHFGVGLLFTMPMISQIVAIMVFEYALWAWFRFNVAQATMIAMGTIGAFIVTGGFIQVLGRLVSKYMGEENYYLSWRAIKAVMYFAIPLVLGIAALTFVVNIVLPFYPQRMVSIGLTYFILISTMMLSAAVLYASQQKFIILVSILVGTFSVVFGMELFDLGIYFSQWLGISITAGIQIIYILLYYFFKIRISRQQLFKQSLPKLEVSYYNTYRYFLYGFSYFTFLFVDRILAWSAGPPPPPYIIWFNTSYELGMDWALLSFIFTIALLEFIIQLFSHRIIPAQKRTDISRLKKFNLYFSNFYSLQLVILFFVGIISILVTYYGVSALRVFENDIPEIRDFFANPITFKVFWLGSIGYLFLVFGLLNSLFFFTMNRPEFVLYSMLFALCVNALTGYVCSRIIGFEYAVVGLVAGSIAFAVTTGLIGKRFFKHLDYFYYSAY
ncbi:MAG: hypothetical protein ABJH08_00930 [Balneola sp.]